MQKTVLKQVIFIIILMFVLIVVMGLVVSTKVNAQEKLFYSKIFSNSTNDLDDEWDNEWDNDWYDVSKIKHDYRYNRVEGLYLGFHINRKFWREKYPGHPFIYGGAGYAFAGKMFQYQVGVEKGFFDNYHLAFGSEFHLKIDTPDKWIMPQWENSLAAFFIKDDFHDYYLCEGWSGYVSQEITDKLKIKASYNFDVYDSVEKSTNWSLFGGKKKFRKNPLMDEGELHSLTGKLVFDTRNSKSSATRGWFVQLEGEHAGNNLKGDFNFDRYLLDFRRYQPLGFSDAIDFRFRLGSSKGMLPWEKSFHLGGISTLRGYEYKQFPNGPMQPGGNRMILAQLEYRIGLEDFPDEIGLGIFNSFYLILFIDTGWIGFADIDKKFYQGFSNIKLSDYKTDIGFGLSNSSGTVRFQIAKRTDTGENSFLFSFRVSRPF